jgi:hypothetical protein
MIGYVASGYLPCDNKPTDWKEPKVKETYCEALE